MFYSFTKKVDKEASFAVMRGCLVFYQERTYICTKSHIAMKDEKNLIERLNNRSREIPIERKEEKPTCQNPCLDCDVVDCPSNPQYGAPDTEPVDECGPSHQFVDNDDKTPFQKMSPSEQTELKELLDRSKAIFGKTVNNIKDRWEDFQKDNNLRDEELIKRWKQYKARVESWIEEHKKFPTTIAKAMLLDEYDEEKKKVAELPWNERTFKEIVDQMFDLYHRKNADYGNAFSKSFQKFGMQSVLMRLTDKYNRLESLTESGTAQVKDESIEDTLMDMANYAILAIIELRSRKPAGGANTEKK